MKIIAITIIVLSVLLSGCQWVEPPPDTLRTEHGKGAMAGCVRTLVTLKGETPNEKEKVDILNLCAVIAVDAVRIYDGADAETVPQSGPVKDLPPGSHI